jgi:hypothetical protein
MPLTKFLLPPVNCSNHLYFVVSNVKNSHITSFVYHYVIRKKEYTGFKIWVDENVSLVAFVALVAYVAIVTFVIQKLESQYMDTQIV